MFENCTDFSANVSRETRLSQQVDEIEPLKKLLRLHEERYSSLEVKTVALNVKLEKKCADYNAKRAMLMERIKSLQDQVRDERNANLSRSAELVAQSEHLLMRQERCDAEHEKIAVRRAQLDKEESLLASQRATFAEEHIQHQERKAQLDVQAEALMRQHPQAEAQDLRQKETQVKLDAQSKALKEREQAVAAAEAKQSRTSESKNVAVADRERIHISAAPATRKIEGDTPGSVSSSAATRELARLATAQGAKKTAGPRVAVNHMDSKPAPPTARTVCGASHLSSSAPPRGTGNLRTAVHAKTATENTVSHVQKGVRSNASRAPAEPKLITKGPRLLPPKTAQPSVAPARIPLQVKGAASRVADKGSVIRDIQPCDEASTSQRKMRSAPNLDKKNESSSSVQSTAHFNKWSAEDLAKKTGRDAPPATAQAVLSRVRTGVAPAATVKSRPKITVPDTTHRGPSKVPISKRLQRQFGTRAVAAFR